MPISRLATDYTRYCNTVKVSYRCMPNIGASISAHNKKILEESQSLERKGCNCNDQSECPLGGECTTGNVFYDATLSSNAANYGENVYLGITEPPWKGRFNNHTQSFRDVKYSKETELSKEIWKLKEQNSTYSVKWRIRRLAHAYNPNTMRCMLCLNEKTDILNYDGSNLLNKRSEIISTCRHRRKHSLAVYDVK